MQRRPNWKPVIVSDAYRAEIGKVGAKRAKTKGERRLFDIRFTIGAALALGLPALIGAGLYLAASYLEFLSIGFALCASAA
jgi:hypothetical protein